MTDEITFGDIFKKLQLGDSHRVKLGVPGGGTVKIFNKLTYQTSN